MKPCVFIQTNDKQLVGALVAQHALKRTSPNADKFDVRIVHSDDYSYFKAREGQSFLRDGTRRVWRYDDLQSFTLTRYLPPELMAYKGRAVVIDPDVFAVGDVWELLNMDMGGKAIMACRPKNDLKGREGQVATSVMLLDCTRLKHWNVEKQFNALFDDNLDYSDWISLKTEPADTIGLLDQVWNHFDTLTPETRLVHNTKRRTQPWKTGLPVDFLVPERSRRRPFIGWLRRMKARVFGEYAFVGNYKSHPDKRQENLFFALLGECLADGTVTKDLIEQQMAQNFVRHDALDLTEKAPPLDDVLAQIRNGGLKAAA